MTEKKTRRVSLVKKQKYQCSACKRRFASIQAFDDHQDWTLGYLQCCNPGALYTVDNREKYIKVRGVWHRTDGKGVFNASLAPVTETADTLESPSEALEMAFVASGVPREGRQHMSLAEFVGPEDVEPAPLTGILGSDGVTEHPSNSGPRDLDFVRQAIERYVEAVDLPSSSAAYVTDWRIGFLEHRTRSTRRLIDDLGGQV